MSKYEAVRLDVNSIEFPHSGRNHGNHISGESESLILNDYLKQNTKISQADTSYQQAAEEERLANTRNEVEALERRKVGLAKEVNELELQIRRLRKEKRELEKTDHSGNQFRCKGDLETDL